MRGGDGYQSTDTLDSAEPLHVIARNQASHAEANQIDILARSEIGFDISRDLFRQFVQRSIPVAGKQVQAVELASVVLKIAGEAPEHSSGIVDAVN